MSTADRLGHRQLFVVLTVSTPASTGKENAMVRRSGSSRWLAVSLAAALLAWASSAQAVPIDYVNVSGTIGGAIGGGGHTVTYSSVNGLTQSGIVNPPSTMSQEVSPNTNTTGQTSASVSVSGTLVNGSQTYQTNGAASADLATGKIGVLGASQMIGGSGTPVNGLSVGSSTIRDEIAFSNANGVATPIDVFFTLSGTELVGPNGGVTEHVRFCLGAACSLAGNSLISNALDYVFTHNSSLLPDGNYVTLPTTGWASVSFTPGNDPTSELFHGVYIVPTGVSSVDLFAWLSVDCRFDAACDLSHTGELAINLAPGVTFNSSSSVLLTSTGNGETVPEPASGVLFGAGALVIAGLRQLRRR